MAGRTVYGFRKRRALSWLTTVVCLAACLGLARPARADDPQTQAAEALYRQAKALMARGELDEACQKFAASHALEPGLGTLLHLGDCYERAGRFASAHDTFTAAAKLAEERSDGRGRVASVRAAALVPRIPKLEVRSSPHAPSDLHITINGVPLQPSELDRPLPRDEGSYEIVFSAPGFEAFTSRVVLENGSADATVVNVPRLVRSQRPRPRKLESRAPSAPAPAPSNTQKTVAWVVGGAGVALGAAALVFTALAVDKNDDSKLHCDAASPNRCDRDGVTLRDDAKGMATAATITGLVGGAAVAGGLVLYLTAPASESGVPSAAALSVRGTF